VRGALAAGASGNDALAAGARLVRAFTLARTGLRDKAELETFSKEYREDDVARANLIAGLEQVLSGGQ
jgi:hypothetical protein